MSGEYTFLPLEKVLYGAGTLARLPAEIERLGHRRAFILTGRTLATQTPLVQNVVAHLGALHVGTYAGIRQHAPESGLNEAAALAREARADVLVSLGGGSPIDAAKLVARLLSKDGVFLPHIALPTTLSAAEYSHVAGYTDETTQAKIGVTDMRLTPRVVILDPELTLATPLWLWLASGIRALDHAVETLYAPNDHPVNDVLALEAIRRLFEGLPRTKAEPDNLEARLDGQLAAWMSYFGPSAGAYLGLSHNLGKRIGATYNVPHGVTSCILLPHVMRYKAENARDAARLVPMAQALRLADNSQAPQDAAAAVASLVQRLDLPTRLRAVNVPESALESIARAAIGDTPELPAVLHLLQRAW